MNRSPSTSLLYVASVCIPFDFAFTLGGVRVTPTEVLFSLALVLWLPQLIRAPNVIASSPYFLPLLFFLAACLLSLFAAENRFVGLRETVQFAWLFGVFYFISHQAKERVKTLTLWGLLLGAGFVVSLIALYQYFFVREPVHFLIAETRLRAHGIYDQPNSFGSYLIGIIFFLFGFYFLAATHAPQVKERRGAAYTIFFNKKVILASLFILSAMLVATFSRGSWIGLFCGMAVLYYLLRKKIHNALFARLLGVMAAAAVLIMTDVYLQPQHSDRSFSDRQRVLLLNVAVQMARDHPWLGVGFGNFPDRLPEYATAELMDSMQLDYDKILKTWFVNPNKKPDIEIVHNTLLQVVAETGMLGLATFVWLFFVYYRNALKRLRESEDQQEYSIRATALASATAIFCNGMFGWPFSHGVQEVLMISLALAISPHH
ncbi:MAG: O-antigen ligase family protein, partial [candidate division KSB1 bacterium]|nr:O-antigen ligase family protein [candidate division KSB1 bacterium]